VWFVINIKVGMYRRCDTKGCDSYKTLAKPSGAYLTLRIKNGLFKVSSDGKKFSDVATLHNTVYLYFGSCSGRTTLLTGPRAEEAF